MHAIWSRFEEHERRVHHGGWHLIKMLVYETLVTSIHIRYV